MAKQRITLLEKSARIALNNAIAARKKLAGAVEAEGDVHLPMFLTREEHSKIVRRMRADHRRETAEFFAQLSNPNPTFVRAAELLFRVMGDAHGARRDAFGLVDDGDGSPHGSAADAIVRAGRKARAEED